MKTTIANNTIVRSGVQREKAFTIAATARAFDILSAGIYSNIPLAVVRELSTNAWDAHVEAGNSTQPFEVHLPNAFEPWLSVRDYGVGMSPEDVEHIYTTYFASTRSGSDDYTGCLGLGSKSPFAYTDQFTVTSRYNGKQYTYSLFKAEGDTPTIALLGEIDTDEHNGIEVRLNICEEDIYKFLDVAKKVYRFFATRPLISGAELDFSDIEPEVEGEGYKLYRSAPGLSRVNVVMGQVTYHVDHHQIYKADALGRNANLVLFAEVNDVQMVASREELQYDATTVDWVNAAIELAIEDAATKLRAKLDNAENKLDRIRHGRQYANLLDVLTADKDKSVPSQVEDAYHMCRLEMRRTRMKIIEDCRNLSPASDSVYSFIHNDVDNVTPKFKGRLRQYMQTSSSHKTYLVSIEDMAAFESACGPVTIKLSDLPEVPRKAAGDRKPPSFVKQLHHRYQGGISREWLSTDNDIPTGGVFAVRRIRNMVIWMGKAIEPKELREIIRTIGIKPGLTYGITDRHYNKFIKQYNFIDLEEVARKHMARFPGKVTTHQLAVLQHGKEYGNCSVATTMGKEIQGISSAAKEYVEVSATKAVSQTYARLIRDFDVDVPQSPNFEEAFKERYPMLRHISYYSDDASRSDVLQYMKMVEKALKTETN